MMIYNGLVTAREKVNAGWAQVENQYQRRLDLVPLLIDGVKTYKDHERDTLTALTEARANALGTNSALAGKPPENEEQLRAIELSQGRVQSALARLFAIVENYPDLKANENVSRLMEELSATENRISFSRQFYNDSAMALNNGVEAFPSNIIAGMFGFEMATYFEVAEAETATPKVDLR